MEHTDQSLARAVDAHYTPGSIADKLVKTLAAIPEGGLLQPTYNDDDIYIYIQATGEIVKHVGCGESAYWHYAQAGKLPKGYASTSGFGARREKLWHVPDANDPRMYCRKRACTVQAEFRSTELAGGVL